MPSDSYGEFLFAQALTRGYKMIRDLLYPGRATNALAIVEDEMQRRLDTNATLARMTGLSADALADSPSMLTAELLMAFHDYVVSVDLDSRYSGIYQLEMRAAIWERRYEELSAAQDGGY